MFLVLPELYSSILSCCTCFFLFGTLSNPAYFDGSGDVGVFGAYDWCCGGGRGRCVNTCQCVGGKLLNKCSMLCNI